MRNFWGIFLFSHLRWFGQSVAFLSATFTTREKQNVDCKILDDSVSLARAHTQAHFFIRLYTHTLSPTFLRTHSLSHIYRNTLSIFLFCTHLHTLTIYLFHTHTFSHTLTHTLTHTHSPSLLHTTLFLFYFATKPVRKNMSFVFANG